MKKDNLRHMFPIRRGLSAPEAALYIGVGTSTFRTLVEDTRMPKPRKINACRVWDIDDLDTAFKSLPIDGIDMEIDTWADLAQK